MHSNDTTNEIERGYCQCGCGEKTPIANRNRPQYGAVKGEPLRYIQGHQRRQQTPVYPPNTQAPWVVKRGLLEPYGKCQCGCGADTPIAKRDHKTAGYLRGHPIPFVPAHQYKRFRKTLAEKFWKYVTPAHIDQCWIWQGAKYPAGYGHLRHEGRDLAAHRVAWELKNGPIPDDMIILHSCDTPSCVNVAHLTLGTHADNMTDKTQKGRTPHGATHYKTVLSDEQVREIRKRYRKGVVTFLQLANEYGVTKGCISGIVYRRSRSNVI